MKYLVEQGIQYYAYAEKRVRPVVSIARLDKLSGKAADLQGLSDRECRYEAEEVLFRNDKFIGFRLPSHASFAMVLFHRQDVKEI